MNTKDISREIGIAELVLLGASSVSQPDRDTAAIGERAHSTSLLLANQRIQEQRTMSINTLLLIVIVVILLGGGGFYFGR